MVKVLLKCVIRLSISFRCYAFAYFRTQISRPLAYGVRISSIASATAVLRTKGTEKFRTFKTNHEFPYRRVDPACRLCPARPVWLLWKLNTQAPWTGPAPSPRRDPPPPQARFTARRPVLRTPRRVGRGIRSANRTRRSSSSLRETCTAMDLLLPRGITRTARLVMRWTVCPTIRSRSEIRSTLRKNSSPGNRHPRRD